MLKMLEVDVVPRLPDDKVHPVEGFIFQAVLKVESQEAPVVKEPGGSMTAVSETASPAHLSVTGNIFTEGFACRIKGRYPCDGGLHPLYIR